MEYFEEIDFLYKKPAQYCSELSRQDLKKIMLPQADFIAGYKRELVRNAAAHGLKYRKIKIKDIAEINDFINARYTKLEGNELSPYDYFRFIKYGNGLILQDKTGVIKGCVFEIGYDTPERTSYPLRLVFDNSIKGSNLGKDIVLYLSLLAIERGSRVNRSVISFKNHESLYIQLNKQGWILTGYNPDIKGLTPYFEACLPLTKHGILSNKVDTIKTCNYLSNKKIKDEFILINVDDEQGIIKLFEKKFVIIALIKSNDRSFASKYLAIPAIDVNYKEIK